MSKIIYDIIQRFEVDHGVPRLVSTNIQVIQGGEDLMSLATNLLVQMGFYEKYEEKRTSQYIGYRFKKYGQVSRSYQLVLSQRKESLFVSITLPVIDPYLLTLGRHIDETRSFWVRPSQIETFLNISNEYKTSFGSQEEDFPSPTGDFLFSSIYPELAIAYFMGHKKKDETNAYYKDYENYIARLSQSDCCLEARQDKLFPYAFQVCLNSRDVLEEFISKFAKILIEEE